MLPPYVGSFELNGFVTMDQGERYISITSCSFAEVPESRQVGGEEQDVESDQ